jgi:hypothetical protein
MKRLLGDQWTDVQDWWNSSFLNAAALRTAGEFMGDSEQA